MTATSPDRTASPAPERALPRLELASLPTPLQRFDRLAEAIGSGAFLVKREDLSGLGMGGNKARQLEIILAEAKRTGHDAIVTTAAAQSNFCRTTAAACAELGWPCALLLRGDGTAPAVGNLLLDRLFGAEIEWIDTTDPYSEVVGERLEALAEKLRARGLRPFTIRLPGATGALAAAAAMSLAEEILAEAEAEPHWCALAAGSGLTAAGLLAGFAAAGAQTKVLAVSVQQPASFIAPLILRRAEEALALCSLSADIDPDRLVVDDRHIGPGYGRPSPASLQALMVAGRTAGLVLDPAYTGKALAGLEANLAEGTVAADARTVFVHTGGAPSLMAEAPRVAAALGPA